MVNAYVFPCCDAAFFFFCGTGPDCFSAGIVVRYLKEPVPGGYRAKGKLMRYFLRVFDCEASRMVFGHSAMRRLEGWSFEKSSMKPAVQETVSLLQGFQGGVLPAEGRGKAFFRFSNPDGLKVAGPGRMERGNRAFAECGIDSLIPHEVSVSVKRTNSAGPCLSL